MPSQYEPPLVMRLDEADEVADPIGATALSDPKSFHALSRHHSCTLPIISYNPQSFGFLSPPGRGSVPASNTLAEVGNATAQSVDLALPLYHLVQKPLINQGFPHFPQGFPQPALSITFLFCRIKSWIKVKSWKLVWRLVSSLFAF